MDKSPALFLVTNLHKTTWYKVEENYKFKKIKEHAEEKERFSDREGMFGSSGKGGTSKVGEPDIMNSERAHQEKKYINFIVNQTKDLLKRVDYKYLVYTAPDRIKNELKTKLKPLKNIENKYIAGNFVNMPIEKLQQIFKNSLKVYSG